MAFAGDAAAGGITVACKEEKGQKGFRRARWIFTAVIIAGIVFLFILYLNKLNLI